MNKSVYVCKNKINMITQKKVTARQYLQLHPEKYLLVTYEFGEPVYIAPPPLIGIKTTTDKDKAEIWSSIDNTETKLSYYRAVTKFTELKFEEIKA